MARTPRAQRAATAAAQRSQMAENLQPAQPEQYLDRLLDNAPIGVIALDPAGNVFAWNRRADEILGKSEREMVGSPLADIFSGENAIAGSGLSGPT